MSLCKDANLLSPVLNLQWISVIQYLTRAFLLCLGLIAEAVMTGNQVTTAFCYPTRIQARYSSSAFFTFCGVVFGCIGACVFSCHATLVYE